MRVKLTVGQMRPDETHAGHSELLISMVAQATESCRAKVLLPRQLQLWCYASEVWEAGIV